MHIEMGDDGRYNTTKIVTITFILKYFMHVPGLKKNLVLVSMLEDRGYYVVFSEGKAFPHHKATRQVKKIEVCVKNLYKLDVDGYIALSGKSYVIFPNGKSRNIVQNLGKKLQIIIYKARG